MSTSLLDGQVAIITGAAGGIGGAVAHELAEAGARLVLSDRDEAALGTLADTLGAVAIAGDVADPALPELLLRTALDRYGRADILHNNAGIMHVGGIDEIDLDRVRLMLRVNVEAVIHGSYVFARHFKRQGRGFILNTSSVAGLKTGPRLAAYDASKFAVEAFTDALRMELAGSGVRVAAIQPGTVDTRLYQGWGAADRDFVFSGGALAPADIARCVRFILEQPPHMTIPRLFAAPAAEPV